VPADGQRASEEELKEYVKRNLARYKVPREIVFVRELPRNSTGKILKRELPRGAVPVQLARTEERGGAGRKAG
jgi:fatty-acyl-CoA synthase